MHSYNALRRPPRPVWISCRSANVTSRREIVAPRSAMLTPSATPAPESSSTIDSTWRWHPAPTACICAATRSPAARAEGARADRVSDRTIGRIGSPKPSRAHAEGGVDYLLFGAVFATASKPGQPPAGAQALADVVGTTPCRCWPSGGISSRHGAAAGRCGLCGLCRDRLVRRRGRGPQSPNA